MIEILITVIILATGVLGVAAMQVTTLQNLNSSYGSSVAEILAEDFSERMKANPEVADVGGYVHEDDPGTGFPACTDPCTLNELAEHDIGSWWVAMKAVLPSADGEVESTVNAAGTTIYVITIRWDDDRSGSDTKNCPVQSAADLDCYRFNVTI